MKKLLAALAVLALLAAGAAWWLHRNLDALVRDGIEHYGSAMTQARVSVGAVQIDAASGRGMLRDLVVGNPAGFKTAHALKAGEIEIEVDIASLTGNPVLVRRIAVVAPHAIYEKGEAVTNFDAIQKNIQAYLGTPQKAQGEAKKLVVSELVIRNMRADASAAFMDGKTVGFNLPDIVLKDVGKAKGGVTPGELGQIVAEAMKQRLLGAISFDRLLKSAGKLLDDAGKAIRGIFK